MARAKIETVQISDTDWMVVKKFKNGLVEKRLVKDRIDIWLIEIGRASCRERV